MSIVVMLNNLFHDFSVALLSACLFVLYFIYRTSVPAPEKDRMEMLRHLYHKFSRIVAGCWIFIILGGIVRTMAFEEYEWMEAAGRGQVTALVVKHIILVSLVVSGTVIQKRLKTILKS